MISALISQYEDSVNNNNILNIKLRTQVYETFTSSNIVKHVESSFETLTPYGGASSKQRGGGGTLRNELYDVDMRSQGFINNEIFWRSLTASKRIFYIFRSY